MRKPIERVIATGAQRAARRVRWWLAALAVALPLLVAFPGTANAITGCPGGDPSAQHCYAFGYFGDDVGGAPVWMDAVGADLTAYCLSVANRNTDFATYEMWMGTNDNGAANTWVEEGMQAGIGFDGANHGFSWFWADSRPPGDLSNFHEHYGPAASVNVSTNVSFYWLGNGNWNVYRGGALVGESAGVGDYAGDAETGAETTTNQATDFGQSSNWQYHESGAWHTAPTSWYNGWSGYGWLNASGYNRPLPGSVTYVSNRGGCNGGAAALAAPRPAPITAATAATRLTAIALRAAAANGDSHPTGIAYVATTRHQAQALLGEGIPQRDPSYLIQLRGHFTGYDAAVPPGKKLPAGGVLTLTVSAATGAVTDVSLTSATVNLRALGRPAALG